MMLLTSLSVLALEAPKGFKSETVVIDGLKFHVYKGGQGDALILLHGYGQSSLMWSKAMEQFKDQFTVIVPDIRGGGQSDTPESGYDKVTMANDIKKLMDHYGISKAKVVGHDVGLMVAYALAATYPEKVESLVVMDAFLPGIGPGDSIYNDPKIWHFRFNGPYAEKLVKGREKIYLDSLWDGFSARPGSFPEASKKHYLSEYTKPGHMRAGFMYFKEFPNDAAVNKELSKTKLSMPVLAMGGEKALGVQLIETMKVAAKNVQGHVVKNCGHWMLEECPQETLEVLGKFLMPGQKNLKQAQESKE
jgi:pimeloyl-ACP methyl ester carboxylesterase